MDISDPVVDATGSWLPDFQPDSRVLDIGCGSGELTASIARRLPAGFVLGVDRELALVVNATLRHPPSVFPNLRFRQAEACELRLAEPPFDCVVSRACLHYLDHPGQAFAAISQRLCAGGEMHVRCMGRGNARRVRQTLRRMIETPAWNRYFSGFKQSWGLVGPADCRSWLRRSGLSGLAGVLQTERYVFGSTPEFLNWFACNWSGYVARVPFQERTAFLHQFARAYGGGESSSYAVDFVWLQLSARKLG